jgi:Amino acid permease
MNSCGRFSSEIKGFLFPIYEYREACPPKSLGAGSSRPHSAHSTLSARECWSRYYFGWDVASNLAEETANAKKVAGFGGIVGVLVIIALFLLAQVAIQMALTSDQIQKNAANLLPAFGHVALSAPWSAIAVLAVM